MTGLLDRLWSRSPAAPATAAEQPQRGEPGTPAWFAAEVLAPGLAWLAPMVPPGGPPDTPAVRRWLLAVAMQESGLRHRTQLGGGPARGFWQFEQAGVRGVLMHPASGKLALAACRAAVVEPDAASVWRAIEGHDRLATALARLLLWTDPHPVPTEERDGWACYLRLWRPGRPRPETWAECWRRAREGLA